MGEQLDRIEAKLDELAKRPDVLVEALMVLDKDMHGTSTRPCATCDFVSKAMGEPFGCYRKARDARQKVIGQ